MKTKIISAFSTFFIIVSLFALGPVRALILGINVSDNSPMQGDIISFFIFAEIEDDEIINIDNYFILELKGPETTRCKFSLKGEILSACNGINITLISSPDFGYGYGVNNFSSGKFEFKIDLDTSFYKPWLYHTNLIAKTILQDFEKIGPDIIITKQTAKIQGCSVRSSEGEFFVLGQNLTDGTKVNFNIPIRNSANGGQGYLISQTGKGRFTYRFDFIKVLDANDKEATLLTSGSYRNGPGKTKKANAILTLDKDDNLLDIYGDDFFLDNSKLTFLRRC